MALIISDRIRAKLADKHGGVEEREILEAFANRDAEFLIDNREEHQSDPPTEWFVAETDRGRVLKVVFVNSDGNIYIKSAYTPNQEAIDFYRRKAKKEDA